MLSFAKIICGVVSVGTMLILLTCNSRSTSATLSQPGVAGVGTMCAPTPPQLDLPPGKDGHLVPLLPGLDVYRYPISTANELAQRYFDQGFILNYGFNHAEAARSFQEVTRLEPEHPMGYWGLAYVLGPNYNAPMFPDVLGAAREAVAKANMFSYRATPKEQALIDAITQRYPPDLETDPQPYYQAYADAMRRAMREFPDDVDIATMTAEALMDLHPWDLWETDGRPKPWTPEILEIIEGVLARQADHPQAMHLYIHAVEASRTPERALAAAHRLRYRVPGAGHLVHMPSHIYIRTGRYHDGTLANERAVRVDSSYLELCAEAGVYTLGLVPHNWHFLAACAALEGDGAKALRASRQMVERAVDLERMYEPEWATLQHFYSIPWYIMVKFAMWDAMLAAPEPDPKLVYPSAIYAYAQAMAHLHRGDLAAARRKLAQVEAAERDPAVAEQTIWDINPVTDLIAIAKFVVQGQLADREGNFAAAEAAYQAAIELEDGLNYNEPPDWFFSVRHYYGDLLLRNERYAAAESVYREDLVNFPANGFALNGLRIACSRQGKKDEADQARLRFTEAWQWAAVELTTSIVE